MQRAAKWSRPPSAAKQNRQSCRRPAHLNPLHLSQLQLLIQVLLAPGAHPHIGARALLECWRRRCCRSRAGAGCMQRIERELLRRGVFNESATPGPAQSSRG